jgi:hypothetical protein
VFYQDQASECREPRVSHDEAAKMFETRLRTGYIAKEDGDFEVYLVEGMKIFEAEGSKAVATN